MYKKYFKIIWNLGITILFLTVAGCVSTLLLTRTGAENNSALIFVLAVVFVSLLTDGYLFGILAALVSTVCINWFFMYPFGAFNISMQGYQIAMISTLTVALVICALTSRIKLHARRAEEREQKAKELYELNSRLQQEKSEMELNSAKAEIRSNMLMAVSHDLRTPLTAIAGSASIILSQNTSEYQEHNIKLLNGIKEQAEWMTIMVENILSLAKLGQENTKMILRPEIPDEIIESCIVKIRKLFPEAQIHSDLSDEVVMVYAESILIRQVLQNLVENAIRHAKSSAPITIRTRLSENKLVFSVEDDGIGVPKYIIDQIQSGKQVHVEQGDKDTGMGIGISACQSILKAHNSKLSACNKESGGAIFSFSLNIVDGEET